MPEEQNFTILKQCRFDIKTELMEALLIKGPKAVVPKLWYGTRESFRWFASNLLKLMSYNKYFKCEIL